MYISLERDLDEIGLNIFIFLNEFSIFLQKFLISTLLKLLIINFPFFNNKYLHIFNILLFKEIHLEWSIIDNPVILGDISHNIMCTFFLLFLFF